MTKTEVKKIISDKPDSLSDDLCCQIYGLYEYHGEMEKILPSMSPEQIDIYERWLEVYEKKHNKPIPNAAALVLENARVPKVTVEKGIIKPINDYSLDVTCLDSVEEKEMDWLIPGFIPRGAITTLGGAGGIGKSFCWAAIAAAISAGEEPFLLGIPDEWYKEPPQKVLFFSAEDGAETVLRKRIRENGGNLKNIFFIGIEDTERFSQVKFNSPFLSQLIEKYRPSLCVFDPLQSFIPPEMKMAERNAMRQCMNYLVGLGKQYNTTFLIVAHSNKRSGASGRQRLADSSDLWDISRSVLMAGVTESGERYISAEKSNYGEGLSTTVIFKIVDGVVTFIKTSDKKDADFVNESIRVTKASPAKDEAKNFLLETLKDGEMKVNDLDAAAKSIGISGYTLKVAKTELKKSGDIAYRPAGLTGKGKGVEFFVGLTDGRG